MAAAILTVRRECGDRADPTGDLYQLLLQPELVPPSAEQPGAYRSLPRNLLDAPLTNSDLANSVVECTHEAEMRPLTPQT